MNKLSQDILNSLSLSSYPVCNLLTDVEQLKLIINNINVNYVDDSYDTPIIIYIEAYRLGLIEEPELELIIDYLINIGANINFVGSTGLTSLMKASCVDLRGVVKKLISSGCFIDFVSENGYTALMEASIYGCKEIVELLINNGCDLNYKNETGKTALVGAILDSNFEIARLLIESGAIVTERALEECTDNYDFKQYMIAVKRNELIFKKNRVCER